jgi:predicted RNA polymerase sigma factor
VHPTNGTTTDACCWLTDIAKACNIDWSRRRAARSHDKRMITSAFVSTGGE